MPYSQEPVTEQSKHWIRKFLPFLVGILLAVLASGLLSMAQAQPRLDILAVGLSAIGSVYVGSAIAQQQQQDVWVETIIAVVCVVIALLGLWKSPPLVISRLCFTRRLGSVSSCSISRHTNFSAVVSTALCWI